jgi:hypothetical protein
MTKGAVLAVKQKVEKPVDFKTVELNLDRLKEVQDRSCVILWGYKNWNHEVNIKVQGAKILVSCKTAPASAFLAGEGLVT